MLKECILAAAIIVSPGQTKKLAGPLETPYIEKGTYTINLNALLNSQDWGDGIHPVTFEFEFGSNNQSFNTIEIASAKTGNILSGLTYSLNSTNVVDLIANKVIAEEGNKYSTFHVDERQEITFLNQGSGELWNRFLDDYITYEAPKGFSLSTIFEELAEGLKNLAIGFVNAFSGLGKIFYNNGLTFVSIFLIGGVALTIGFWAIDKVLGLAKMGLGSLGKARAKKSKKGQ